MNTDQELCEQFHNICKEHNIDVNDKSIGSKYAEASYWFFTGVLYAEHKIKLRPIDSEEPDGGWESY